MYTIVYTDCAGAPQIVVDNASTLKVYVTDT